MWEALIWAIFAVLIGLGSWTMSLAPPDYFISRSCFLLATLILLARFGWWLAFEYSGSNLPRVILAFVIFGTIGLLWVFCMKWVTEREHKFTERSKPLAQEEQTKHPTAKEIAKEVIKELPTGLVPESKQINLSDAKKLRLINSYRGSFAASKNSSKPVFTDSLALIVKVRLP